MSLTDLQSELDANWTKAYSQVLSQANGYPDNSWISNPPHFNTPIRTRYVIVEFRGATSGTGNSCGIPEMVFYGTKVE
jgi:hypothetical protein